MTAVSVPVTVGMSLKTYFSAAHASSWLDHVAQRAGTLPAVATGQVSVFIAPSYLQIPAALRAFAGTPVAVGAQDVSQFEPGAYTGEVTAAELAEVGVQLAEIGHAERRALFGETDEITAAKVSAALAAGLRPVLCVGESDLLDPQQAGAQVVAQLHASLAGAPAGPVTVAYEPVWAIGAPEPAGVEHITAVTTALRAALDGLADRAGSAVIYGGSAGPGLLTELGHAVDGLFLGRFGHDVENLIAVLDEAAALAATGAA
ncbi:MAG: triose-phosphate isomerase family protein [Beutenbergiaceae bacterium]